MSETFYQTFGRRLAKRRRAVGLTQADLAKASGFSRSAIGNVERGEHRINLHDGALLARIAGCTLAELIAAAPVQVPESRPNRGRAARIRREAAAQSGAAA